MVAAKSRRSGKASQALRLARGEVLSDRYPTQYLPEVGRQVMADGGVPMSEGDRNAQLNDLVAYADRLDRSARAREAGEALAQTWPVQLARSVVGGAALPRDVYEGRVDPTSEIGIQRAADLAGTVMGGGMGASRPAGSVGMGGRDIRAYHGSPHDFDRFDLSKIGTGEGNQAYGRGLYFAEREPVAKDYRDRLTQQTNEYFKANNAFLNAQDKERRLASRFMEDGDERFLPAIRAAQQEMFAAKAEADRLFRPGHMYEVNIRANPEQFLDWDKPLAGQKAAMDVLAPVVGDVLRPDYKVRSALFDANKSLREAGEARRVEDLLREAGLPGIKYLDRGSRAAGEGSRNYVVFDDKLIDILRKYAKGGFVADTSMAQGGTAERRNEDGVVERAMDAVSRLFGRAPATKTVAPDRRAQSWTTPEELETAKKNDLAYGDPSAGFFQPGARVRMPSTLVEMQRAFNQQSLENLPARPTDQAMSDRLYSAWLASRSSPVAALGFDPRAMVTAPSSVAGNANLTLGGTYSPSKDLMFTTGQHDSTYGHEAIHRGLQKLREANRLPKDFPKDLEEILTRAMMMRYYGGVEKGRGEAGDQQISAAEMLLKQPGQRITKIIDDAEAAAAKLIAEQRPRGPR